MWLSAWCGYCISPALTTNNNIFRSTCTMKDSFKVHFSCCFFCFVVVICDLVHDVETVFIMP